MTTGKLQRYYDRNTDLFLRIGSSGSAMALHRGLWGPGVSNGEQAARFVHQLIADAIRKRRPAAHPLRILDLGCGVGGTLFDLARHLENTHLTGITLSARQVEIAHAAALRLGLSEQCGFLQGDFEEIRLGTKVEVILALESFAHTARPDRFLATCAAHLVDGGLLIVIDDFLGQEPSAITDRRDRDLIGTFRAGWHLPALSTLDEFLVLSASAGFRAVDSRDLSPLIRTRRPRDRLVAAVSPIAQRLGLMHLPFWSNVIGGNALNSAIRGGLIRYCMTVAEFHSSDGENSVSPEQSAVPATGNPRGACSSNGC